MDPTLRTFMLLILGLFLTAVGIVWLLPGLDDDGPPAGYWHRESEE